jgi:hypothetical protein
MRWFVLGVALLGCRDHATPEPRQAPTEAATPARSRSTPRARPELPAPAPGAHAPEPAAVADRFAAEPVDPAWKATTEAEIRRRVPNANAIECRRTLCQITLVGTEHDLGSAMDQLETEQSLRGIAQSVLLTAPVRRADGNVALQAYARFVHDEP